MASAAKKAGNEKKRRLAAKYRARREALKQVIADVSTSVEDRDKAQKALQALPRNSSPTRIRNRCFLTGRPRGYYRKFGLSRIALRELALRGEVPGVTKSSW